MFYCSQYQSLEALWVTAFLTLLINILMSKETVTWNFKLYSVLLYIIHNINFLFRIILQIFKRLGTKVMEGCCNFPRKIPCLLSFLKAELHKFACGSKKIVCGTLQVMKKVRKLLGRSSQGLLQFAETLSCFYYWLKHFLDFFQIASSMWPVSNVV